MRWARLESPPQAGAPRAQNQEWARLDSNQGPTDYESAALPLSYGPLRLAYRNPQGGFYVFAPRRQKTGKPERAQARKPQMPHQMAEMKATIPRLCGVQASAPSTPISAPMARK